MKNIRNEVAATLEHDRGSFDFGLNLRSHFFDVQTSKYHRLEQKLAHSEALDLNKKNWDAASPLPDKQSICDRFRPKQGFDLSLIHI